VTGGAGFIGSWLVGDLLDRKVETIVYDDFSSGSMENLARHKDDKLLKVVTGDIRKIRETLADVRDVDGVFHLAAIASVAKSVSEPMKVHDVNVNGSLEVMNFCLEKGVKRMVFASSAAVYGPLGKGAASEDLACAPASPYGASKLAIENYMSSYYNSYGLETVVLRIFNVYGAGQRINEYSGVIAIFANSLLQQIPPTIFGDGEQTRDFVSVRDVVQANRLAITAPGASGQVFNIASGVAVSLLQLLNILRSLTGTKDVPQLFAPTRPGDIKFGRASIGKAREVLGYDPRIRIEDGLVEVVEYLKETGARGQTAAGQKVGTK
jgi:UDP-glucose 4-epimerase